MSEPRRRCGHATRICSVNAAAASRVLLLSGGIGGAKLALGFDRLLPSGALTVVANTGDDFRHLGFAISPDLDTLMYTLADQVNTETGWGCRDESWQFMAALERLGGPTWFRLGDRDLATHAVRTQRLQAGEPLSTVTRELCARFGINSILLPMTDATVATQVDTADGVLAFQDYFVRRRAEPRVTAVRYAGAVTAPALHDALAMLDGTGLTAILIAPSNPWLSIAPILSIPGWARALREATVPVIAVSPLVGGAALKGPTAKIMGELGLAVDNAHIAGQYSALIGRPLDGLIIDTCDARDAAAIEALGTRVAVTQTVMRSLEDRLALARSTLQFATGLKR